MPTLSPLDVMRAAGIQPDNVEEFEELMRILERLDRDPQAVAVELINARRSCRQAVKAAEDMEGLLKGLVSGQATLWRFESLREEPDGTTRAICRLGAQLRTAAVHPDVSVSELEGLQPWEFVLVNEGVIVGLWKDDPCLLAMALGDVVTFKGVVSEDDFQVRVGRDGQGEAVVTLAAPLRLEELTPEMRLVLHRDDPRWAIAAIPAQRSESPFEERLDGLVARLDNLAGLDGVAETLMKDVLLRIVFPQL
ncbi:MAG TPA: hypothetical protein VML55_14650, partial [Planctomycetaceae bacterium]|nr:hypothetical protein [Planctomycetaceae bacterium]